MKRLLRSLDGQGPQEFEDTLRESMKVIASSSETFDALRPGFIEIRRNALPIAVIGDVHGDLRALLDVFLAIDEKIGLEELGLMVFLGDMVDRGYAQVEVLSLLLKAKLEEPSKLLLLRGNHEPPPWLIPFPHDFPEMLRRAFPSAWRDLLNLSYELFERLPLVARLRGFALFLHGGPPTSLLRNTSFEEALGIGNPAFDDETLEEILWSDPAEDVLTFAPSPRGAGKLYGRALTERALSLSGTRYLIRAHEPVDGYRLSHKGKVVTLFSAKNVYGLRRAGYAVILDSEEEPSLELLAT